MSATVLLRVTCERCDKIETIEPVEAALRYARGINANSSADHLKLHELRGRPAGWGTVEWKRANAGGTTVELCGDCMDRVLDTINGGARS
jgi:hypothetical protein